MILLQGEIAQALWHAVLHPLLQAAYAVYGNETFVWTAFGLDKAMITVCVVMPQIDSLLMPCLFLA